MGWQWPQWGRLFRDGGRHPDQLPSKRRRFEPTLQIRKLEPRRVLSVTESFAANVWTLQSDGNPDTVTVSTDATNISVTDGVTTFTQAKSDVHRINFVDVGGIDSLILTGDVSLMGDAGISLTITGFESVEIHGNYNLGGNFSLTGGSLTSFAGSTLMVTGTTAIDAAMNDVMLTDGALSFLDSVSITNADDVELDVTGSVSLDSITTTGRLIVTADDTIEDTATGVIQVAKAASFSATDIVLDNGLHDFALTIQANAAHDAHLTDVNDLRLHDTSVGNDLIVSAVNVRDTVTGIVTVQRDTTLMATNILLDDGPHGFNRFLSITTNGNATINALGRIRLDQVSVGGNFKVTTDEFIVDTVSGTIDVDQTSQFTAAAVTLDNGLHLFQQNVSSTTTGQTVLTSAGALVLDQLHVSGALIVSTTQDITDAANAEIRVTGLSQFNANLVLLDSSLNDYVGQVTLDTSSHATLRDATTIVIKEATVGGVLTLTAADDIVDQSTGAIQVTGATVLQSANVRWDNGEHDFGGAISAQTSGDLVLTDINNIRLHQLLVGGSLSVSSGASILDTATGVIDVAQTAMFMAVETVLDNGLHEFRGAVSSQSTERTVLTDATGILLDQVTVGTGLVVTATNNISDTTNGLIHVSGTAQLTGRNILLDNVGHDFSQAVTLSSTFNTSLRDANSLVIHEANIGRDLTLVATQSIVDTNTGTITVAGRTDLSGTTITLDNGTHEFVGSVSAMAANEITLTDINRIILDVVSTNGALQVTAGDQIVDTASGSITVGQNSTFRGTEVLLDNGQHDFGGAVSTESTLRTILTDINDLLLGTVDVGTTLRLNVVRDIAQAPGGSISVTGTTVVNGRDIDLSSSVNDFVGSVTILSARDARIRDANDLTLANVDVTQDLAATANARLLDIDTARIQVGRDASFVGGDLIRLADAATNRLEVVGRASFETDSTQTIDIGSAGASGAQIRFGSLGLTGGGTEIYETDDTHLADVNVASLVLSTADQVTQVIGTAIEIRNIAPAMGLSLFLRSGSGQVELARGSADPVGSVNTGPLSENRIAGGIVISGAMPGNAGVDATSNVRLRNIAPQAQFPVFNGLPNGTDLTVNDLELHFTRASIAIPDYRFDIRGQLDLWAGLDGNLANPGVQSIGRTITDGSATELQVAGDANFLASGNIVLADSALANPGDLNLAVDGRASFFIASFDSIAPSQTRSVSVGVQFVAAANDTTRGQLGGNFEAGRIAFHVGTAQRAGNVTIYERSATVVDQGVAGDQTNLAATLVLTSDGDITDAGMAHTIISGVEGGNAYMRLNAGAGASNIVLGDEMAELRFQVGGVDGPAVGQVQPNGTVIRYLNHYFAAVAANVSLQVDSGINFRADDGDAQTPRIETNIAGTWSVAAEGNIYQVGRAGNGWLRASRAGFQADAVLLYDTEFDSFAADVTSAADVRLLADISDRLPFGSFQPSGTPEQMAEQLALRSSLLPYVFGGNVFNNAVEVDEDGDAYRAATDVPLEKMSLADVPDAYGIVIQNRESLRVEEVADAAGMLGNVHGIASVAGNVYTETRAGVTDGDLQFVGSGPHDAIVHVMGNSLFTALASGEVEIASGTVLRSGTGTVTQVSDYMAYDGRVANNTQAKEGVYLDIIPPSPGPDAPTSMFLQMIDDGTITVTHDIAAQLGTSGESNLYIAVRWANQFEEWSGNPDVYDVRWYENEVPFKIENMMEVAQPLTVDLAKPFTLTELRNSPFAQFMPASIMALNDLSINLYELQGGPASGPVRDLSVSSFTTGANPVPKYAPGQLPDTDLSLPGNYVVAILTVPTPAVVTPSVSVPPLLLESPPAPLVLDPPPPPLQLPEFDDVRPTVVLGPDRIDYGRQENDMLTFPRESWTKGTDIDYEEAIKKEISENKDKWLTTREATEFRIEVRLKNGTFRNIDFWMDVRGKITEGRLPKNDSPADQTQAPQSTSVDQPATDASVPNSVQNSPVDSVPVDAAGDDQWLAAWSSWRPPLAEETHQQ